MSQYAVITADIINSRSQTALVSLLKNQLSQINSQALLTAFTVSRGDEIQAVCNQLTELPVLIRRLRYVCWPLKLRVAAGIGVIDSAPTDGIDSWQMNGMAFFAARHALDKLKNTQGKNPATMIQSDDPHFDLIINTIYSLYDLIINKWTEKQWITVHSYEIHATLLKTAMVLNVSWQNIQKIQKAAHWETIKSTEASMAMLFANRF
jgi:hypothetical protein